MATSIAAKRLTPIHHESVTLAIPLSAFRTKAQLMFLIVLLSCDPDGSMPTSLEVRPGAGTISSWNLSPVEYPPDDFVLVDSVHLVFDTASAIHDSLDLGVVTQYTGPVVVEITGTIVLGNVSIPLSEVLHSHGTLWWEHAMILLRAKDGDLGAGILGVGNGALPAAARRTPVAAPDSSALVPEPPLGFGVSLERRGVIFDFLLTTDSSDEFGLAKVIPQIDVDSPNRALLVLDAAARGRMQMRWSFNVNGQNYIPEADQTCLEVFDRCVPFPPVSRLWTVMSPSDLPRARGDITVRAYRKQGGIPQLTLSRDAVRPVFGRRFNAETQELPAGPFFGSTDSTTRHDTLRITIPGAPAGASVAARRVVLLSRPVPRSGGHRHNAPYDNIVVERPTGRFFTLEQVAQLSVPGAGTVERFVFVRPIGVPTTLFYRSAAWGGLRRSSSGTPGPISICIVCS